MNSFGERLVYFREKKGYNQAEFAVLMEISPQALSRYEKNKVKPSYEFITKLTILFSKDIKWLLSGEGNPEKKEEKPAETVKIKNINQTDVNFLPEPISEKKVIPFYELYATAGDVTVFTNTETPSGYLEARGIPGFEQVEATFPVFGSSMEPFISRGDIVGIKRLQTWDFFDPQTIYMIITDDQRMIKKLRVDHQDNKILWCSSPNHPDFKIDKKYIQSVYKVVVAIKMW